MTTTTSTAHHINYGTNRRGGSMIAGGGNWRESTVWCSCGWEHTWNGQTYQESVQAGRDHLKDVGVYNTSGEQDVFANIRKPGSHLSPERIAELEQSNTADELAFRTGRNLNYVKKALAKFIERGNVVQHEQGGIIYYTATNEFFSWSD